MLTQAQLIALGILVLILILVSIIMLTRGGWRWCAVLLSLTLLEMEIIMAWAKYEPGDQFYNGAPLWYALTFVEYVALVGVVWYNEVKSGHPPA